MKDVAHLLQYTRVSPNWRGSRAIPRIGPDRPRCTSHRPNGPWIGPRPTQIEPDQTEMDPGSAPDQPRIGPRSTHLDPGSDPNGPRNGPKFAPIWLQSDVDPDGPQIDARPFSSPSLQTVLCANPRVTDTSAQPKLLASPPPSIDGRSSVASFVCLSPLSPFHAVALPPIASSPPCHSPPSPIPLSHSISLMTHSTPPPATAGPFALLLFPVPWRCHWWVGG